jgi:hypothetical protein
MAGHAGLREGLWKLTPETNSAPSMKPEPARPAESVTELHASSVRAGDFIGMTVRKLAERSKP